MTGGVGYIRGFQIHGDNIVECERTLTLIERALGEGGKEVGGPQGSVCCPSFQIQLSGSKNVLQFTFLPGFGRWNRDILDILRKRGAILREAPDAIVTNLSEGKEEPILALEYCGALPAGNQAWQRSGRAYSLARAKVPYVYVAEMGGYELDAKRARKAARLPNPAVPFSYLSLWTSVASPVIPVFVSSPGAKADSIAKYEPIFGEADLLELIRNLIVGQDTGAIYNALREKALKFVILLASERSRDDTLSAEQWRKADRALRDRSGLVQFLITDANLPWSKTAYIGKLTKTARKLMGTAADMAMGLTSKNLPMCVISGSRREEFASRVVSLYGRVHKEFAEWLKQPSDLVISWVMGFKPGGEDARPDRGLPPLARMLIGEKMDLMTVVYGPAPKHHWRLLENDPITLMKQNGLWESILAVSDAVLVDSATRDEAARRGYVRGHWGRPVKPAEEVQAVIEPIPKRIGEHDVDTVMHILFARFGEGRTFEGMCNPPGGDWSGISLLTPDRRIKVRWLSLPRVSGTDAKRPDHVFEIFDRGETPVILSVESKEQVGSVETKIGGRLNKYMLNLLSATVSIEREMPAGSWTHSERRMSSREFSLASAVCFIGDGSEELRSTGTRAGVDLVLGLAFQEGGRTCQLCVTPITQIGKRIAEYLYSVRTEGLGISIEGV